MPIEPKAAGDSPAAAAPRWLTADEQSAWRAYIRLAKMLMRQLDRDLHPFGLTTNDYEILVELSESPHHRLRMTELADLTAQSRSRLSHQVTRMEARGLVQRDACEGDKRGTFAVITASGLAIIERVAPYHVESVRRHFMDQFSGEQLATMVETFEPALEILRKTRDRD
jgi:DNA-binding MarR family transcriptional regulator